MASLIVEIQRGDCWNKLTTIRITSSGPADRAASRRRAKAEAAYQLRGWQKHYPTDRLRIREVA